MTASTTGDELYVLDLFSGTGELGLRFTKAMEARGIRCRTIAYCDIEKYPQSTLFSRMEKGEIDTAPIFTDVNEITGDEFERVDAIIGGFPCQDISTAGLGKGLDGERSVLFFQITRLARKLRPAIIGLENVSAILIRGGGRVASELASIGYDLRATTLSAAEIGATHRRNRWWGLAHANGHGHELLREAGRGEDLGELGQDPAGKGRGVAGTDRGVGQANPDGLGHPHGQPKILPAEAGIHAQRNPPTDCREDQLADTAGRGCGVQGSAPRPGGERDRGLAGEPGQDLEDTGHRGRRGKRETGKGGDGKALGATDHGEAGRSGQGMGDTQGHGERPRLCQGEGRAQEAGRRPGHPDGEVVNAQRGRCEQRDPQERGVQESDQGCGEFSGPGVGLADSNPAHGQELLHGKPAEPKEPRPAEYGGLPARPPAPNDTDAWKEVLSRSPEVKPAICGVSAGIPYRNDRIRILGNGVDAPTAETAFYLLLTGEWRRGLTGIEEMQQ